MNTTFGFAAALTDAGKQPFAAKHANTANRNCHPGILPGTNFCRVITRILGMNEVMRRLGLGQCPGEVGIKTRRLYPQSCIMPLAGESHRKTAREWPPSVRGHVTPAKPAAKEIEKFLVRIRFQRHISKANVDAARPQFWDVNKAVLRGGAENKRGYKWAYARPFFSGMNTILPPNREVCMRDTGGNIVHFEGVCPPGSRHQGGCHVLMADGAVIFITDSIEAGNSSSPQVRNPGPPQFLASGSQSPFGLWGALGTRASKETIEEQLNQ